MYVSVPFSEANIRLADRVCRQVDYANSHSRLHGAPATLTLAEWIEILNKSEGKCSKCGKLVGIEALELDHVNGVQNGTTKESVRPLCMDCNRHSPRHRTKLSVNAT
jgi:5-methylcytosine-specific restriction endonuclease McrA